MKEFEAAAQLVTDVYSCATRGEAFALVLSYRKSVIENLLEDKI